VRPRTLTLAAQLPQRGEGILSLVHHPPPTPLATCNQCRATCTQSHPVGVQQGRACPPPRAPRARSPTHRNRARGCSIPSSRTRWRRAPSEWCHALTTTRYRAHRTVVSCKDFVDLARRSACDARKINLNRPRMFAPFSFVSCKFKPFHFFC
jgi:hypothetical protein